VMFPQSSAEETYRPLSGGEGNPVKDAAPALYLSKYCMY